MKNQPNEMVTLEWLLPLFDQQLSQVHDGWQADKNLPDHMGSYYHNISGALTMVNLPQLAMIASKLSLLAILDSSKTLDTKQRRIGQFAHKLLHRELTQYAHTGTYRCALIDKTINKLSQKLSQTHATLKDATFKSATSKDSTAASNLTSSVSHHARAMEAVDIAIPDTARFDSSIPSLQAQHYKQLLLVWRQKVQELLAENSNQPTILASLEKVSRYVRQTTSACQASPTSAQLRLWYLAELWLNNLAHNTVPLPKSYASLLAQLDYVLDSRYRQATDLEHHSAIEADDCIAHNVAEDLIADLYVQISSLAVIDQQTQSVLSQSSALIESNLRFLPRILTTLDTLISDLNKPQTLIHPLQQLKKQLERRGWSNYQAQVSQIIANLQSSMTSESVYAKEQEQIARQLQELHRAIQVTEYSIQTKIGEAASFLPVSVSSDSSVIETDEALYSLSANSESTHTISDDDNLRQLRIAVEDIKNSFNDYIKHQQISLLPSLEMFVEIGNAFDDMGLTPIRQVSDKLGALFTTLETHHIKSIDWKLTQALAESVIAIELLLDYLAQQVFDQHLLKQADQYIDKACNLAEALIAAPDDIVAYSPTKPLLSDVVRYDDSGEVVPTGDESNKTANDTTTEAVNDGDEESKALQDARAQTKPDNFEMDEDIRDIFIEEATEVLENLEDFLPIWQQDTQDLSPLTEIRRGFHTLKGSGRMVGAFSVSEPAWAIENMLNRILDKTLPVTEATVALVTQTVADLSVLVADFTAMQAPTIDPALTILQSTNLLAGQPRYQGMQAHQAQNEKSEVSIVTSDAPVFEEESNFEQQNSIDTALVSSVDGQTNLPEVLESFMAQELPADAQDSDPDIKEIFIEEAQEVLADIIPRYEQWRTSPSNLTELKEIRRGFHTLKGSGRMVGAYYTAELAWAIEDMLNRVLEQSIEVSEDIIVLIADVLAAYPALIDIFASDDTGSKEHYPALIPLWIACAQAYSKQHGDKFSYNALRTNWLLSEDKASTALNDHTHSNHDNSEISDSTDADSTLEKMNSINEQMADASVVATLQTEDEQAFCKIFVEEAQALLKEIKSFVHTHQGEDHVEVTDEIVRAFHTLRAASGSSALSAISDVSATIEHSLEQLQNHDTAMNAKHLQALAQSVAVIENHLSDYEQNQESQNLPAESHKNKQALASIQAMLKAPDSSSAPIDNKLSVAHLLEADIDGLLNVDWELAETLKTSSAEQNHAYIKQQIEQIERLAFNTQVSPKFTALLDALETAYRYLDRNLEAVVDKAVQTALIAGHQQLTSLFDALAAGMSLKIDQQILSDLQNIGASNNAPETDSSAEPSDSVNAVTVQSRPADELQLEIIDTDIELLEIFLEEAQELDSAITQSFSKWQTDTTNKSTLKVLQRHLHTIKGGARMAGIRSIGDLTHEAESIYEAFVEDRLYPTEQWLTVMQMVQDTLSLQIDHLVRYQEAFFAHELIEQLQQFEQSAELPATITLILPVINHKGSDPDSADDATSSDRNTEQASDTLENIIAQSWSDNLPDPDILEVFLEEADEIIASSNTYLQAFLSNVSDVSSLQALQRDLHTIKGGARMVAANGIADLAHEMETVYEELAILKRPATKMVSKLLTVCHDWLADAVFILKQHVNPITPKALIAALQRFSKNPDDLKQIPDESLQAQRSLVLAAQMQQKTRHTVDNLDEMPSMLGSFMEQEQSAGNNEMIRISGGVIEHMINLSGESAINRARIDMGMSSLTNSIEEMGTTVQRLADQLRRMEIELEAQILSQIDDAELVDNEDFDPLEMDQYSSLNQLSKSLTESASDLIDINSTLLEKTRDSESLLLQLSRTQTELQDGLMNSRMVPFTRLTPRLERIVRQTANELNKSVELVIVNADDEIDRTILERITSPLEHMLRNAVDHGIENTQTRLAAGKERSGNITLEVLREGSEVVINLTDDGRGINVEAVREKAISQGLIDPNDDSLTDLDIMQYIFNAGLTTTQKITQISGRGVGMDVVISEIRQLGGMVSVTSKEGEGSRFTIRVPLTVAISDALVVRAADRYYAIPLVQIERVIRINPEKLYEYYQSGAATLHIEDDDYRVRYLNEILTGNRLNELVVSTNSSLPLILIKNRAGRKLALQVDQIAGSRIEVVVKPLGRQLSHLAGISAATIMGDGSVMLILDLMALMRNAPPQTVIPLAKSEHKDRESQVTVLVVDDSVTVRKVTSRLLERQGINVAIAKDGIDAIEILQETIPDLMLLDIEMPRMDGFEVATQVRHNKRLQHIPIIMITSRTGEKHRTRALEIGVNDYMGKPFQENDLLDRMQNLLGEKISLSHDG